MTDGSRDNLFADARSKVEKFEFDENVASVFTDMISRSIPGYRTIVDHSGQLAGYFARPNTNCYDLGCSLGATTKALHRSISGKGSRSVITSAGRSKDLDMNITNV